MVGVNGVQPGGGMPVYQRNRATVATVLSGSRVVVVMNTKHVKTAEHMVNTMWEVYQAGLVAETTFRIDEGIIREAMPELSRLRQAEFDEGRSFVLGVGSIICDEELALAQELAFDMLVGPTNMQSGGKTPREILETLKAAQDRGYFLAPAVNSPQGFGDYLNNVIGFLPDMIKIFPAGINTPERLKGWLPPFVRPRFKNIKLMPTEGVDYVTGPKFIEVIQSFGFQAVMGMSAPLKLVEERKAPGDISVIRESLDEFKRQFREKMDGQPFGAIK